MAGARSRRELALVVLVCAAGAAVALLAAGRGWLVDVTARPAPLADLVRRDTGGDLRPWLPALAWAALAGAGALLATRGLPRQLLGGLLVTAGAAIAVGAGSALGLASAPGWPVLTGLAGLLVVVAGALAVCRGGRWPAMGARYERRDVLTGGAAPPAGHTTAGPTRSATAQPARYATAGPVGDSAADTERLWSALDRGEDPTAR